MKRAALSLEFFGKMLLSPFPVVLCRICFRKQVTSIFPGTIEVLVRNDWCAPEKEPAVRRKEKNGVEGNKEGGERKRSEAGNQKK